MLALTDEAVARLLIAASRFPLSADRIGFLEKFAAAAERRPRAEQLRKNSAVENRPPTYQLGQMAQLPSGGSTGTNLPVERRPRRRSRAAANQASYRARDRAGVRIFRFPLSYDDLEFFADVGWLPDEKLADHDAVVAAVLRELRALRSRYR